MASADAPETSESESPSPAWIGSVTTAVTGVLAAAVTTVTALAALAGGGQRLLLNEPGWALAALACFSVGLIILFAVSVERQRGGSRGAKAERRRRLAIRSSGVLIVLGILIFLGIVVMVGSRAKQPNVFADFATATDSVDGDLMLKGTATSSEFDLDHRLWVMVLGFCEFPWPDAVGTTLLIAQSGPGGSDHVELPFTVPIRAGEYQWVMAKAWEGEPGDLWGDSCIDFELDDEGDVDLVTSTSTLACVYVVVPESENARSGCASPSPSPAP